jgi:hypothetical protein
MDDEAATSKTKSHIEELTVPTFRSLIPEHLVKTLDDKERWIIAAISRLEQQGDWLIQETVENRRILIELDERLQLLQIREKEASVAARELELKRQAGMLVEWAVIRRMWIDLIRLYRSSMLKVAARVCLDLEAECAREAPRAAVIERIVDDRISDAMAAIYDSRFVDVKVSETEIKIAWICAECHISAADAKPSGWLCNRCRTPGDDPLHRMEATQ